MEKECYQLNGLALSRRNPFDKCLSDLPSCDADALLPSAGGFCYYNDFSPFNILYAAVFGQLNYSPLQVHRAWSLARAEIFFLRFNRYSFSFRTVWFGTVARSNSAKQFLVGFFCVSVFFLRFFLFHKSPSRAIYVTAHWLFLYLL